jgi:cell division protein FtsB
MTVDEDTKSASEIFGEVTDLLQSQTQEYIQEIARTSGQAADPQMFYFIVKQFYKVD